MQRKDLSQNLKALDSLELSRFLLMDNLGLCQYFGVSNLQCAVKIRVEIEREQIRRHTAAAC